MRAEKAVRYATADGASVPAVVVAVVGTGPSTYKRLDVAVGAEILRDVPHVKDAAGGPCWHLPEEDAPVVFHPIPEPAPFASDDDEEDVL